MKPTFDCRASSVVVVALLVGCGKSDRTHVTSTPQYTAQVERIVPLDSKGGSLSIDPRVEFVGSQACIGCHRDEYESYRETTHSRALGDIVLADEPIGGEVEHKLSGKNYRIYRRDGQLRHREFIPAEDGSELLLADHPMRSVIGSGNHSRSYLIDIDGFLFESPVTWYTSKSAWGMSPGYKDNPEQPGFARPITAGCLYCHTGRIERPGGLGRLRILEKTIGCERCHGAGSLHVEQHEAGQLASETTVDSIVHPGRLAREHREAICAQCHLASAVQIEVHDRQIGEFRPGLPLTEFRVDYHLDSPESSMTVVGHVEQMRLSQCYQQSDTMTCTTCHNPHDHLSPATRVAHFNEKCLTCHQATACGLEEPIRLQQDPTDNCVACHMPQSPTDIPHFAFTHHRIGIHPQEQRVPQPATSVIADLLPIYSIYDRPEIVRQRCLGLAYVQLADTEGDSDGEAALYYQRRGRLLLEGVRAQGLLDPEVDVALAWIYRKSGDHRRAIELTHSALASGKLTFNSRRNALAVAARSHFELNQFDHAASLFAEISVLRLNAEDQMLLSLSSHRTGDFSGAFEAAKRAAELEPGHPDWQELLAELYRWAGNSEMSATHNNRAARLRTSLQAVVRE